MSFALGDNDEAPTTITSKQTKFPEVFKSKLKLVSHLPAKNFKEIVKIKCDNHKILDNFRQIKNYSEECPCHHTIYLVQVVKK